LNGRRGCLIQILRVAPKDNPGQILFNVFQKRILILEKVSDI